MNIRVGSLLAIGLCVFGKAVPAAPTCSDPSRQCLEAIARTYIGALVAHDGSQVPLMPMVRRTENALVNANGEYELRESFMHTEMVQGARDIRLMVDEQRQEVAAFYLLDIVLKTDPGAETQAGNTRYKNAVTVPAGNYTVHEAERFKIDHGRIAEVEVLGHVETGLSGSSGWPK